MKEYEAANSNYGQVANTGWLRRLGAAGFAFFLAKGLVWLVAATWLVF